MTEKFFKSDPEKMEMETIIYHNLRKEASYLSGGEAQRLAKILTEAYFKFRK